MKFYLIILSSLMLWLPSIAIAQLPIVNNIESGQVSLSVNDNSMYIDQSTTKAVINWDSFNIGSDASVSFQQPDSSSITLNRINGMNGRSIVAGRLTANGQIVLTNSSGMLFTPTATIDVAGLVASTASIRTQDFLNNHLNFSVDSGNISTIHNQGFIFAADQGLIALVAPHVINDGVIVARQGNVILANSNNFTIDLYGDDLIHFTDTPINSSITQTGAVFAHQGLITLSNQQAKNLTANTVNLANHKHASNAYQRGGKIILTSKGSLRHSGQLNVTNYEQGAGGLVKLSAKDINISNGFIDASGLNGGGEVYVGGLWQGADGMSYANNTFVDVDFSIFNNAIKYGDGGVVVLWSDKLTDFRGTVFAKGGEFGGNGGSVEVSSLGLLKFTGSVNTSALYGHNGLLLLDPADIYIVSSSTTNASSTMDNYTTTMIPSGADVSYIDIIDITNALVNNNVTITNASGSALYDIHLDTILTHNSLMENTLSLIADRNIYINKDINFSDAEGGVQNLNLLLAAPNGNITWGHDDSNKTITIARLDLNSSIINGPIIAVGGSFAINNLFNGVATINNSKDATGAAIQYYINYGLENFSPPLIIDGFTIDTNNSNRGIYSEGSVTVLNSIINNNFTTDNGGGVYAANKAVINASNNVFQTNIANNGGAIYSKDGEINSSHNIFYNNSAVYLGGSIYSEKAIINSSYDQFRENSSQYGGALLSRDGEIQSSYNMFYQNKALDRGGAIYSEAAYVSSNHDQFSENDSNYGGAVYTNYGEMIFDNNVFYKNTSIYLGGAIYSKGGKISSKNSIFNKNHAVYEGGAIYSKKAIINSSYDQFRENSSQYGGALLSLDGEINSSYNKFYQNKALDRGGAIYSGTAYVSSSHDQFRENDANNGGALFLKTNTANINNMITYKNAANNQGGAFYIGSGSNVRVSSSAFYYDSSVNAGDVLFLDVANSFVEIINSVVRYSPFSNNSNNANFGNRLYNTNYIFIDNMIPININLLGIYNYKYNKQQQVDSYNFTNETYKER